MENSRFKIYQSDEFALGIAVNCYYLQIGFIAWIITIKFRK